MKLGQPGKNVLLLHLVFLVAGAIIGFAFGGDKHFVLGISLGSLLGTLIPGLVGEYAVKRNPSATEAARMCAAVYSNHRITSEEMREIVQEIRGQVYGPWMGLAIGAPAGCYLFHLSGTGCLAAALGLGLVTWLGSKLFS